MQITFHVLAHILSSYKINFYITYLLVNIILHVKYLENNGKNVKIIGKEKSSNICSKFLSLKNNKFHDFNLLIFITNILSKLFNFY